MNFPKPIMTYLLLAANVVVFGLMAWSGVRTGEDYINWGANFGPLVRAGEWWRLLSAMFLHIGALHVAVNMYALHILGPIVEISLGRIGLLILFVLAGTAGSVASVLWHTEVISAGASGAIYGLLGAIIALLLRKKLPGVSLQAALRALILNLGISLIPGIDMAAHVGGLIAGFFVGLSMNSVFQISHRPVLRQPLWIGTIGFALLLALVMYFMPMP